MAASAAGLAGASLAAWEAGADAGASLTGAVVAVEPLHAATRIVANMPSPRTRICFLMPLLYSGARSGVGRRLLLRHAAAVRGTIPNPDRAGIVRARSAVDTRRVRVRQPSLREDACQGITSRSTNAMSR